MIGLEREGEREKQVGIDSKLIYSPGRRRRAPNDSKQYNKLECRQDYTVGTRGRVSKGTCEHQLVITNSSSFFCFFMSFFFYMILPLCTERVKAPGYKERFK